MERAELSLGERALDLGCGTGLNLAPVQRRVGPQGSVVGVDASRPMPAVARSRCGGPAW
ncbi:methyltransferase domain-containing protein [uncultured Jatrophihabitans sp.]|uniref:methyltransferase domain-containing protein n=1 Tax=uncultured Jatrophihabitans sp. TaxID=1610747 RepID=UPI0035C952EA